jgi:hypothetical protein
LDGYRWFSPVSANAFDSPGEACLTVGKTGVAVKSYEKSFELNPENRNAAGIEKMLKNEGSVKDPPHLVLICRLSQISLEIKSEFGPDGCGWFRPFRFILQGRSPG